MRKLPKKTFSLLRSILPHTAKNTQISIDASRRALRRKASACAEWYAVLAAFHHCTKRGLFYICLLEVKLGLVELLFVDASYFKIH
jgi:hypothetical protein